MRRLISGFSRSDGELAASKILTEFSPFGFEHLSDFSGSVTSLKLRSETLLGMEMMREASPSWLLPLFLDLLIYGV